MTNPADLPATFKFNAKEAHDCAGFIFQRCEYFSLITYKPEVSWLIARDMTLTEDDVYVREYNAEGKISRYMALTLFNKMVEMGEQHFNADMRRNLDVVKKHVADFYKWREERAERLAKLDQLGE